MNGLFDPCSIPPEAISASGADPATAECSHAANTQTDDWRIGTWKGDRFLLTIYVTTRDSAEQNRQPEPGNLPHLSLPQRASAWTWIETDFGHSVIGDLSVPVTAGLMVIRVTAQRSAPESPLITAGRIATVLNRHLPD